MYKIGAGTSKIIDSMMIDGIMINRLIRVGVEIRIHKQGKCTLLELIDITSHGAPTKMLKREKSGLHTNVYQLLPLTLKNENVFN
jgi:hypothetical protein